MNKFLCTAIAFAFLSGASLAIAQTKHPRNNAPAADSKNGGQSQELKLSPDQKSLIFAAIRRDAISVAPPPRNLAVAIGAQFPSGAPLYALPDAAISSVPDAKPYKFTIVNDTLILVDPASMQVVATIRQ